MRGEALGEVPLPGLARLRQGTYRLLSALVLYPSQETLRLAPPAARHLRARNPWAAQLAFYEAWDGLLGQVAGLRPARVPKLQAAYSKLFIGNEAEPPVPICESGYLDPMSLAAGRVIGEVESVYAAAGLRSAPQGVAPDHAATELGFLSFLCGQEAEAWEALDSWRAQGALRRQGNFLVEHLFRWLPLLANAVSGRDEEGFHTVVTRGAWSLIAHDADFVIALDKRAGAEASGSGRTLRAVES